MILDGAAVVQMQNCGTTRTFKDYGELVFALYISAQLEKCNRVDLVWDVYVLASLKASTRQKSGKGTRKRVAASTVMPKNWKTFYVSMRTKLNCLRSCHPKQFAFTWYLLLADRKELYATDGSHIDSCLAHLAPCSQEADTRLPLHAADAMQKGCKKVAIRTVDADVLVLDAASFSKTGPDERCVAFGVGTNYQYIAAHEMVATMTPTKCLSLPVLHAFTGCDTVSSFASKAKKTAWETWKSFSEVNGAFKELYAHHFAFIWVETKSNHLSDQSSNCDMSFCNPVRVTWNVRSHVHFWVIGEQFDTTLNSFRQVVYKHHEQERSKNTSLRNATGHFAPLRPLSVDNNALVPSG